MSVWRRGEIWYFQFSYKGRRYSGRAGEAKTAEEARDVERQRKRLIWQRVATKEAIEEGTEVERIESKVQISVDENLLKQLLERAITLMEGVREGDITTKKRLAIKWQFIIEVAAGVFIGRALYGVISSLAASWPSF